MYGAGRTIGISLAGFNSLCNGVTLGIGSSIAGSRIDQVLTQFFNILLAIPTIMFGLVVVAAVGSSIPVLIITAGAIFSPVVFRLSRALGMEIMVMDFVEAAKVRGEGYRWIIFSEIWPNAAMPLISDFGLRFIYVILFVSEFEFSSCGVQPPLADWGSMVRENLGALQYGESAIPILAPAIAIASLTVAINLIVDDVSAMLVENCLGDFKLNKSSIRS